MLLVDQLGRTQLDVIDGIGPKFDVTNVAEYYYHHPKEYWMIGDDFPNPKPPFESMWVEYRYPRNTWSKEAGGVRIKAYDNGLIPYFGCFVSTKMEFAPQRDHILMTARKPETPGEYGMFGGVWYVDQREKQAVKFADSVAMRFDLDADGNIDKFFFPEFMGKDNEERSSYAYFFHPVLMAFSFRNCKNIEVVQVSAARELQKARVRRGKLPLMSYHVINVLKFGKSYRSTSRQVESDGTNVALHIRAGNFARYGERYKRGKLFGKYEGMFWRPQVVVGSAERGVSTHDYAAKIENK